MDEIARKKADAEAKRQTAINEKKQADEAKRLAAEAQAKKKADTDFDKRLLAIVNNPKETLTHRQIAAIALGLDPNKIKEFRSASQLKNLSVNAVEREAAKIALRKNPRADQRVSNEEQLRAIMKNANESPAARQIARIALGQDEDDTPAQPKALTADAPKTLRDQSSLSQNIARLNPPASKAVEPSSTMLSDDHILKLATSGFFPISPKQPTQSPNLWVAFTAANAAALNSAQGQILTATLAAAGSPVAKSLTPSLAKVGDAKALLAAADAIRRRDVIGGLQIAADYTAVKSMGAIGAALTPENPLVGRAIAEASTQYVLTTWKLYGAPVVGDGLVTLFPDTFIPASRGASGPN